MELLREAVSVLFVFALLAAGLWTVRRDRAFLWKRAPVKSRSLQQVDRLALTPQHTLHLIRVDGRDLVIATHPKGCTFMEPASLVQRAGAQ